MEEKKNIKRFYLILFAVVICMPCFLWLICGDFTDSENFENRNMASRPILCMESYADFPAEYESYFNDHLLFRNDLVLLNSRISHYLFHVSENENVIDAKDGWLFYANSADGDPIACYQGRNLYSQEQLQAIVSNLTGMQQYLAARGVEFVVFIAPNKERMYPEMMPDFYGAPADEYGARQLTDYIKENTDIRIVYPYEELIKTKEALAERGLPYLLYYKTDTHWNALGGYVGSSALLQELGIELPDLFSEQITITQSGRTGGDLAGMMQMGEDFKDYEYEVSGYGGCHTENDKWDFDTEIIYHSKNADPRKIYVVRDSFCSAMSEFIGSQFDSCYMVKNHIYNNQNFLEQSPDIFVLEIVERYSGNLAAFDIRKEAQ